MNRKFVKENKEKKTEGRDKIKEKMGGREAQKSKEKRKVRKK